MDGRSAASYLASSILTARLVAPAVEIGSVALIIADRCCRVCRSFSLRTGSLISSMVM